MQIAINKKYTIGAKEYEHLFVDALSTKAYTLFHQDNASAVVLLNHNKSAFFDSLYEKVKEIESVKEINDTFRNEFNKNKFTAKHFGLAFEPVDTHHLFKEKDKFIPRDVFFAQLEMEGFIEINVGSRLGFMCDESNVI